MRQERGTTKTMYSEVFAEWLKNGMDKELFRPKGGFVTVMAFTAFIC